MDRNNATCKLSNSKSSDEINNNKSSLALFFSREIEKIVPMPNLLIEEDMGMCGVLQLSSKKICIVLVIYYILFWIFGHFTYPIGQSYRGCSRILFDSF